MRCAQPFVMRVMSDLTLFAAVDHSPTPTALLELYLASRLIQSIEFAGGVGASDELPGQLHVHLVIQSQGQLRHSQALIKTVFDKKVDERALTGGPGIGILKTSMKKDPCKEIVSRFG